MRGLGSGRWPALHRGEDREREAGAWVFASCACATSELGATNRSLRSAPISTRNSPATAIATRTPSATAPIPAALPSWLVASRGNGAAVMTEPARGRTRVLVSWVELWWGGSAAVGDGRSRAPRRSRASRGRGRRRRRSLRRPSQSRSRGSSIRTTGGWGAVRRAGWSGVGLRGGESGRRLAGGLRRRRRATAVTAAVVVMRWEHGFATCLLWLVVRRVRSDAAGTIRRGRSKERSGAV